MSRAHDRPEHRHTASRRNCRNPEDEQYHAPIDFGCHIDNTLFALEHTRIELFTDYLRFQTYVRYYIDPISETLTGTLPKDVFRLTIRINLQSLNALKLRKKRSNRVVAVDQGDGTPVTDYA